MDFLFNYISVSAFWTILLTLHMLLSVALLGAITHQALSVLLPVRRTAVADGFVTRFRRVPGASYAGAVSLLWVLTFLLGAWIYTHYRVYVRVPIEQEGYWLTLGAFELKEHLAVIGLAMLPIYWIFWQNPRDPAYDAGRRWTTGLLAAMVWFMFLTGHVVNNTRGFGS